MKKISMFAFVVLCLGAVLHGQDKAPIKISGYMFGDLVYNVSRDTSLSSLSNVATGGARDYSALQFRRIYLTFDQEISSTFSTRFRLEGTTGAPFIKDAYIKWKGFAGGTDLMLGIQPTPAFEVSESYWGFRSVEKTILDLRGIVSSRDFGISAAGKADNSGMVKYKVMIGNNSGTGAETDKYKRFYAHVDLTPADKFRLTLYSDYKAQPNINDPRSTTAPKSTLGNNVLSNALFLGYAEKNSYSVGAELFYQITANGYIRAAAPITVEDRNAMGVSLFGTYTISPELSLIGRYDYFDPNIASSSTNDARNYIIAGASWNAEKNVSIIPNIQVETYENAAIAGGSRAVDASVTGRVTFYYAFN